MLVFDTKYSNVCRESMDPSRNSELALKKDAEYTTEWKQFSFMLMTFIVECWIQNSKKNILGENLIYSADVEERYSMASIARKALFFFTGNCVVKPRTGSKMIRRFFYIQTGKNKLWHREKIKYVPVNGWFCSLLWWLIRYLNKS